MNTRTWFFLWLGIAAFVQLGDLTQATEAAAAAITMNSTSAASGVDLYVTQDPPPEPEPDPDEPDPDYPDDPDPANDEPMGDEPTEPPVEDTPQQPIDRGARPNTTRPEINRPQRPARATPQRPTRAQRDVGKTTPPTTSAGDKPRVAFDIEIEERPMGRVVIEVDMEGSPLTAQNFIDYVDAGFYNNTIFHRIIQDFIIQGGGFTSLDTPKTDGLREPIKNEAKPLMHHNRGTIAAARVHRKRDSATSQFFINLDDNNKLDRQRYCVFGRVVEGMELVERLGETPTDVSDLEGPRYKTKPMVAPKIVRAYRYGSTPAPTERPTANATNAPTNSPETAVNTATNENPSERPAATMAPEYQTEENQPGSDAAMPPASRRNRNLQRPPTARDDGNPIPVENEEEAAIRQRLVDQVLNDPSLTEEERQKGLADVEMLMKMRKIGGATEKSEQKPREKIVKPVENKRPPQTGSRSPG